MTTVRELIRRAAIRATTSVSAQRGLEWTVARLQTLMGVGSGGDPASSGEVAVLGDLAGSRTVGRPLCVMDVGANKGQFLALLADTLPAGSWVAHVFEPSTAAFKVLRERWDSKPEVRLNHLALGSEPGTLPLYSHEPGVGISSLYRRRLDHFGVRFRVQEEVAVAVLDSYCALHAVETIDLLKLDVEGHELHVLRGAERLLGLRRIRRVMFELGGCNIDSRTYFQDFWYFFRDHGFTGMFRVAPGGTLVPVESYSELYEQFRTTNYLAVC